MTAQRPDGSGAAGGTPPLVTRRPPFDPELVPALEESYQQAPVTLTNQNLAESRQAELDATPGLEQLAAGGAEVTEITVPGARGNPDVPLLVIMPPRSEPVPVLFHTHGGGMVMGNNRTGLDTMIGWVTDPGLAIVSADYRLAPEHPFPAGADDCYAGLEWVAAHADELGLDAEQIIVGGGSAGGCLAAACALMARDRGGPQLLGQLLVYPMLDDRMLTASSGELHGEGIWDSESNRAAWDMLLGDQRGQDGVSAYAAPARAADLSGLPAAYLDVGSVDTLRDETLDYARRIWAAGGVAELHVWPGAYHAFDLIAPGSELATAALAARYRWLTRILRGG
jgi:acetyl esterase/lipase